MKSPLWGLALLLICSGQGLVAAQEPGTGSGKTEKPFAVASEVSAKVTTYEELRHAISVTKAASRQRVEQAVEQERVREAWEIGRLIDAHVLQYKQRAGYAGHVLERLAKDLGMSKTELYYMLKFSRAYPIFPSTGKLGWGDYRELLSVNNAEERGAIAEQAVKNKWSQKELRQAVRKVKSPGQKDEPDVEKLPSSVPGKPGTYRVIQAFAGPYKGKLALDLGFSNYYRPAGKFPFKDKEIVASEKGKLRRSARNEADLFTYEADVYRVLDGDTIMAVVDLGFGFATTQTLRLRGIDAPEILTADGVEAKKALEKMIAGAKAILIKTVKSDKYDRYLADVFIEGLYVNQALVENGYAVRVQS